MAEQRPSKTELVDRTMDDMKRLVKAQVRDVARDFKGELEAAGATGIFWGLGGLLAAAGVTTLFIAVGLKLSRLPAGGTLSVGLGLLAGSAGLIAAGWRALPKEALDKVGDELRAGITDTLA